MAFTMNLTLLYFIMIALVSEWFLSVKTVPLSRKYTNGDLFKSFEKQNEEKRKIVAPKFMMDLYRLIVNENGDRKKGIRTNGDKIRCFFAGSTDANELRFDISDISDDEKIIRADLQLFQLRNPSKATTHRFTRVDITSVENGASQAVRLLHTSGSGWRSFRITGAVKKWHQDRHPSNAVRLTVQTAPSNKPDIEFSDITAAERAPFLVVFTENKSEKRGVADRPLIGNDNGARFWKQGRSTRNKRGQHAQPCKRKSMVVDMKKIGWDRYIIAPQKFDAYRCEGKCRVYTSKAVSKQTDHSVLQAMLSQLGIKINGRLVRPPCCAPSQFESKTLLVHRETNGQSVISMEDFYDIVVKSCACL